MAISMDDEATQARFKASLKAPFSFVADPKGRIVALYDAKMPVMSLATRVTYVVDQDQRIVKIDTGSDAIKAGGAIAACPLRRKAAAEPAEAAKP